MTRSDGSDGLEGHTRLLGGGAAVGLFLGIGEVGGGSRGTDDGLPEKLSHFVRHSIVPVGLMPRSSMN